jgi:DNA-binding beta-propeller fold protein YncE/mono/diheme cytochrome c family protein
MRVSSSVALASLFAAVCAAACGGASPEPAKAPIASKPAPVSCARSSAAAAVAPLGATRASSTVALGAQGGRTLAYVADEDVQGVVTIDVDSGKQLATTPLGARPSHVMFLPDGRLVIGLRDTSKLQVLEPTAKADAPLDKRCAIDVAAEPVALALSPDDATLYVSSGWGRALGAYDAKGDLTRSFEVALPREPRGVVASEDGRTVYVAHAVGGQVSAVDLTTKNHGIKSILLHSGSQQEDLQKELQGAMAAMDKAQILKMQRAVEQQMFESRASCQGFALAKTVQPLGRILAPQVVVEPGDPRERPSGYGSDNDQTEVPDVAVIDSKTGEPFQASIQKTNGMMIRAMRGDPNEHHHEECLLPRAAAYDEKNKSLLVTCLGIDAVVEYDALAASPARAEKRRWIVAAGPTGVTVDPSKHRALVWSQFDRTLDVIPLDGPEIADEKTQKPAPVARITLAQDPSHPVPVAMALGRLLFHAVGDARISHDGRACASCHPDGRDDALVWATPEGPRRSIMLAGRVAATSPYSWSGSESTLKEHLDITFDRLKGAGGLRSLELDALAAYVATLSPPVVARKTHDPKVDRGAQLFASKEVGCSSCHAGAEATDNKHHDVQSKGTTDKSGMFNTPTLKFVGGTGPYFHDGRYKTLHELLKSADRKMGHTAQLSDDDLDALEAYVRTL